tara:strand:+ start:50 stop:769 length:720 start_codon:yes stop_codon:yes gene_type:complete
MLALKLGNSITSSSQALSNVYSLNLDGVDQSVTADGIGADMDASVGTYSVWCKIDDIDAFSIILMGRADSSNQISLYYSTFNNAVTASWKAGGTNNYITTGINIEDDNKWHHIALTWDKTANQLKLYQDGVLKDTVAMIGTFAGSISLFDISSNTDNNHFINAKLAQAAVFTRVVPIGELFIADQQPVDLTGSADLVGYFELNEGAGTVANDSSGSGNTGLITNLTSTSWSTDVPYKGN